MKRSILALIVLAMASEAIAQRRQAPEVKNRYGMTLILKEGKYDVQGKEAICKMPECSELPADAYQPYTPDYKITEQDYQYCRTEAFTFKEYPTHNLKMEVDLPTLTQGKSPFIIYVHGGGWQGGGPEAFRRQSQYLASRGIAGVRITYTLIPNGGNFDMGMEEMQAAWDFVVAHADTWNLDLTRSGYAGGSAGTPLASLQTMRQKGCKLYMGCNGVYDFERKGPDAFPSRNTGYFADYSDQKLRDLSPINNIPERDLPAVIVFHGTADTTISYMQSVHFADRVAEKGGKIEKCIYPLYKHAFFNYGSSDKFEEVTLSMYRFAKHVFKAPDVNLP